MYPLNVSLEGHAPLKSKNGTKTLGLWTNYMVELQKICCVNINTFLQTLLKGLCIPFRGGLVQTLEKTHTYSHCLLNFFSIEEMFLSRGAPSINGSWVPAVTAAWVGSMSVTGAWLSREHEISASDWLRHQFLAVVLASQSEVACICTLSAFYYMAKQQSRAEILARASTLQ